MHTTLYLLDIGNTSARYGIYQGGRLLKMGTLLHPRILGQARAWFKRGSKSADRSLVLSSVVPSLTKRLLSFSKHNVRILVAGKHLKPLIKHKYRNINMLGIDRQLNVYGALRIYKPPFVILDYGTAITADYVSVRGVFEGGLIIPGPQIAFQALLQNAALIPKSLRLPRNARSFLGKTTYDGIRSGILEGYGAMADELIARFKRRFGNSTRAIVTGGFAAHLKPYMNSRVIRDSQLSLKSMILLYKAHKKTVCAD